MTEQAASTPVQIAVNLQYVKDFSFESPNAPQVFAPTDQAPTINVGVNVQTRALAENTFEVVLMLKLDAQLEGKTAFIAELSYGGVLTVPALPEEQLKYILLVEGPRLLFPFARAILADAVRDGGFPQVLIAPLDFAALYQANKDQTTQPRAANA